MFAVFNLGRSRPDSGWMIALPCIGVAAGLISFAIAVIDIVEVTSRKTELCWRSARSPATASCAKRRSWVV